MRSIAVTTSTPVVYICESSVQAPVTLEFPLSIVAVPGSGGTLAVAFQVIKDGAWVNRVAGVVTTTTARVLNGPVYALRFTAATADGTVEISA